MGIQPGADDGLEYIISEKLHNTLPTDEKAYWHPLNYEILSGQLQAWPARQTCSRMPRLFLALPTMVTRRHGRSDVRHETGRLFQLGAH